MAMRCSSSDELVGRSASAGRGRSGSAGRGPGRFGRRPARFGYRPRCPPPHRPDARRGRARSAHRWRIPTILPVSSAQHGRREASRLRRVRSRGRPHVSAVLAREQGAGGGLRPAVHPGSGVAGLIASLPGMLAAADFRMVVERIASARGAGGGDSLGLRRARDQDGSRARVDRSDGARGTSRRSPPTGRASSMTSKSP